MEKGIRMPLPPHCGYPEKGRDVTVRTILICHLCSRPYDLVVNFFPDATLGSPRYWCRDCLRPRNFSKRLRQRIAAEEAEDSLNAGLWDALSKLLAIETAFEEGRAESLAA